MARRYVVLKNDTLSKIALATYGDRTLAARLADFNALRDPNKLLVGQVLVIPTRKELIGPAAPVQPPPGGLRVPNGLTEILDTFGNIYDYIDSGGGLKNTWESDTLGKASLPFPIPLSWDQTKVATSVRWHKRLVATMVAAFAAIQADSLERHVKTYGGCYQFRPKRTSQKISSHSWGIALDLNPETNAQGSSGDMDQRIVGIFKSLGFSWGGDWTGKDKDPMHFQFCTGY